jgi:hypothetical protein
MRLYVEPMDAVVIDVASDGRVRLENEDSLTTKLPVGVEHLLEIRTDRPDHVSE